MTPTLTVIGVTAAVLCTNANYDNSLRCQAPVDTFIVEENGEAWGHLTNGIPFTQKNIINDYTRLQRFQMENYFYFVTDRGTIEAESDLEALSVYLSR